MVTLGRVLEEKGQYTDALIYLKKGLTIREEILEEGHPDTVSALAWIGVSNFYEVRCTWYSDLGFEVVVFVPNLFYCCTCVV